MRILFVDDSHERHRKFKMNRIGCIVVQAYNYAEAIKCLDHDGPFDEAYLDHDLSDAAAAGQPGPEEKTGTDIAKHIAQMPKDKLPAKIYIHSYNFAGRTRMAQLLADAGIRVTVQPFTA